MPGSAVAAAAAFVAGAAGSSPLDPAAFASADVEGVVEASSSVVGFAVAFAEDALGSRT